MIEQLAAQFARSFTLDLGWKRDGQAVISPTGKRFENGPVEAQAYELLVQYRDSLRRKVESQVGD